MRILLLGAAGVIHTLRWRNWFSVRGHDTLLATLDRLPDDPTGMKRLGTFGFGALRYRLAIPSLLNTLRKFKPDVVNAHYVPGYGFLAASVPLFSPLVVSTWGSDILLNPQKSPFHKFRARFTLARADLVTSDGPVLAAAIERLGAAPGKILDVPMGVDPALFHPGEQSNETPAVRKSQPGRPLRVVSTRRLEKLYDIECLLRAAVFLAEAGWNFELKIIGDGSERQHLESIVQDQSLNGRVEFLGSLAPEQLSAELARADIYVSSSLSDSTSVSLLEAMACGCFPVVSDIEGNRHWVEHSVNGLLYEPAIAGRLADCLVRAFIDHDFRAHAGKLNLDRINRDALWDNNMRQVEQAFFNLIK